RREAPLLHYIAVRLEHLIDRLIFRFERGDSLGLAGVVRVHALLTIEEDFLRFGRELFECLLILSLPVRRCVNAFWLFRLNLFGRLLCRRFFGRNLYRLFGLFLFGELTVRATRRGLVAFRFWRGFGFCRFFSYDGFRLFLAVRHGGGKSGANVVSGGFGSNFHYQSPNARRRSAMRSSRL